MNYTLHQLHIFLKVIEFQSITRAAEELHLTQPAVSIQIQNLQNHFEIPIMEVVGRKVYITQFGKEVAEVATRINKEINSLNTKVADYKGQLIGTLKIMAVSTGKYVMPSFLADFIKLHPGIDLKLDVTNRSRVIKSLEKNEVDFALVSLMPDNVTVEHIELMENELYLVGRGGEEKYNEKVFDEIPLIFREPGSGTRFIMEKFIKQNNFKVVKKMELTSNEAVKQAVIAGLGYSIMPLIGIRNEIKSKALQIIPLKGFPVQSTWKLVYLKSKNLSPVATRYRDYILKEKERIINERFL